MRTVILAAISALILTSGAEAHHRPGHASPLRKETLWKEMLAKETLYVYDAFEQRLGQYTSQGCFIREVDRYWVEICGLDAQGNHEYAIYFLLYSEPQCRGQAYLTTFWMMDPQHPEVSNTHGIIPGLPLVSVTRRGFIQSEGGPLVFAGDPIQSVPVKSYLDALALGGDCIDVGDGWEGVAGPAIQVNISDWVPPFSVR